MHTKPVRILKNPCYGAGRSRTSGTSSDAGTSDGTTTYGTSVSSLGDDKQDSLIFVLMQCLLSLLQPHDDSDQSDSEDGDIDGCVECPVCAGTHELPPTSYYCCCGGDDNYLEMSPERSQVKNDDSDIWGSLLELLDAELSDDEIHGTTQLTSDLLEAVRNKFPLEMRLSNDVLDDDGVEIGIIKPETTQENISGPKKLVTSNKPEDSVVRAPCLPNEAVSDDVTRREVSQNVMNMKSENVGRVNTEGKNPGGKKTEDGNVGSENAGGNNSGGKNSREGVGSSNSNTSRNDVGGNGAGDGDEESNAGVHSTTGLTYPCADYKRLCLVMFPCCQMFYPCHRCHNNNARCDSRDKKGKDATLLKCLSCNEIQSFTDKSQNCVKCGIQFADYYCESCKHLTDLEKKPYHCSKCGICRIQGDRSFHCDLCGVCLDLCLRGRHQCQPNSAHQPCSICLQDAFTGCQILPCGHKVHKDCAQSMIRRGMDSCPTCKVSFAHLLHRKPGNSERR